MNTDKTTLSDTSWVQSQSRSTASVMIVDDDSSVLMVGKAILSTLPYPILEARSGEAALAELVTLSEAGQVPSIIVLDLTMPGGMSGLETLQVIQSLYPKIGVIACSGFLESSAHELCCALGFMDCIEKPYTTELLTSTVRRCMAKVHEVSSVEGDETVPAMASADSI